MKNKILIVILFLSLCACEIQKRRYTKGFHLSSLSEKPGALKGLGFGVAAIERPGFFLEPADSCDLVSFSDGTSIKVRVISLDDKLIRYRFCDDERIRSTSISKVLRIDYASGKKYEKEPIAEPVQIQKAEEERSPVIVIKEEPPSPPAPPPPPPADHTDSSASETPAQCDRILFRNGIEVKARVTEISDQEVRYKKCDLMSGPDFVESKSRIFMIVYKNGSRDVFSETSEPKPTEEQLQQKPRRTRNAMANWAFVCAMVGFTPMMLYVIPGLLAIVLSSVYISRSNADPETYPATRFAKVSRILGIVSLCLAILFIYALTL